MSYAFFTLNRDKSSNRPSAALQHLRKKGTLRTKAPFGWKYVGWDKDLESVPEQQIIIKRVIEMHKQGMTLSGIATRLNTEGANSCLTLNKASDKVQVFYGQTIKRILMNEGVIKDEKIKTLPLQQRIISHHKDQNTNLPENNIVQFEGSGPIFEILS